MSDGDGNDGGANVSEDLTEALLESLGSDEKSAQPEEWEEILDGLPDLEGERTESEAGDSSVVAFYKRESAALHRSNPARAALMNLESALAAEREGLGNEVVERFVELALVLCPDGLWLLPAARKLMMRLGRRNRALELCQLEVKLREGASEKVSILLEAATLERYVLREPRRALELVNNALTLEADHVRALCEALALQTELGLHREAARTLDQLAGAISSPNERAILHHWEGTLRETYLNELDAAEHAYEAATQEDPTHLPALAALCNLMDRRAQWRPLIRHLSHLVELVPDAESKSRLLVRAAGLLSTQEANATAADQCLAKAVEVVPPYLDAVLALVQTRELKKESGNLIEALFELLELVDDPPTRAWLLTKIADLDQSRLGDLDSAEEAYRNALEEHPRHPLAFLRLSDLLDSRESYDELVRLLAADARHNDSTDPPEERAVRYIVLAELLTALGRPEAAIDALSSGRASKLEFHSSFWELNRLLAGLQLHSERAELLRKQLEVAQDAKTTNHLRGELGRLLVGPLMQDDEAIEVLSLGRDGDPNRGLALDRIEIYQRTSASEPLAELLLREAGDTEDAADREAWSIQAATLLAYELERVDEAFEVLDSVLAEHPAHALAVRTYRQIALSERRWDALIKLSHHILEAAPAHLPAGDLWAEIATAHAQLGDAPKVVEAFEHVLELEPARSSAAWDLESVLRSETRWSDLVLMLERYAQHAAPEEAVRALCRAAEVSDWVLNDLERAERLFREVDGHVEHSREASYGLLRVLRRAKKWKDVAKVLQSLQERTEAGEECSRIELELALVQEFRIGEPPDLALYQSSAGEVTEYEPHLRGVLTRVRRLLKSEDLAPWLKSMGERSEDALLSSSYFLESANRFELAQDEVQLALPPSHDAHARQPDSLNVLWTLERLLNATKDWGTLAVVRERMALQASDPDSRVQILAGAILAYVDAKKPQEAKRVARECLNFDAHCLPALLALAHLSELEEDWRELATLCDRLAEACSDAENRFSYCLKAADLWSDEVGDSSRGLASLAVALSHDPTHEEAFGMAERLLRDRGELDVLSRLFTRCIEASPKPNRVELLSRHALLLRDEIGDLAAASAELTKLLAITPDAEGALVAQAELLGEQGRWAEGAQILGRLVDVTESPEVRHSALMQQARIQLERLRQIQRARASLTRILAEFPEDLEASKLAIGLAIEDREWDRARELLEIVIEHGDTAERVWAMVRLADVARRALWAEEERRGFESGALVEAMSDSEVMTDLVEEYRAQHELPRLIDIGKALLEDGSDPDEDGSLKATLAGLLLDAGQLGQAITYLNDVLGGISNEKTNLIRARTYEADNQLQQAESYYRRVVEDNLDSKEGFTGLIRVLDKLGEVHSANAVAAVLSVLEGEELEVDEPEPGVHSELPGHALDLAKFPLPPTMCDESALLTELAPYLGELFPADTGRPLERSHPGYVAANRLFEALGLGSPRIVIGPKGSQPWKCTPRIGVTPELWLEEGLLRKPLALEFWVGFAAVLSAGAGALLCQLSDAQASQLLEAILSRKPTDPDAKALRKAVLKHVPRALKKTLKNLPDREGSHCDPSTLRDAEIERAIRLGCVISRAPAVALTELNTPSEQLLRFLIGEKYRDSLAQLWKDTQLVKATR